MRTSPSSRRRWVSSVFQRHPRVAAMVQRPSTGALGNTKPPKLAPSIVLRVDRASFAAPACCELSNCPSAVCVTAATDAASAKRTARGAWSVRSRTKNVRCAVVEHVESAVRRGTSRRITREPFARGRARYDRQPTGSLSCGPASRSTATIAKMAIASAPTEAAATGISRAPSHAAVTRLFQRLP